MSMKIIWPILFGVSLVGCATSQVARNPSSAPGDQQVEQKVQKIIAVIHADMVANVATLSGDTNLLSDLMYPNGFILFKKYPGVFGNPATLAQLADENCGRDNYTIRCIAEQVLSH